MGIIIPFPASTPRMPGEARHAHRRRCSFAPASLHVYRRSLIRRMHLECGGRPAALLDALAWQLLRCRCA